MVHFFCPNCWKDFGEDKAVCPFCGFRIRESWDSKNMVAKLIAALNHPDSQTVIRAVWLLGEKQDKHASKPLISMFKRAGDVYLALEIVRALSKIGNKEALDFLNDARSHPAKMIKDEIKALLDEN
jgi:HEAT repeat protein